MGQSSIQALSGIPSRCFLRWKQPLKKRKRTRKRGTDLEVEWGRDKVAGSGARQKAPEIFSHLTVYHVFFLPHHMTDGVVIITQELHSVHLQNSNKKNHPIFLSSSQ